ncbi:MAG: acyltransferase [Desulfobulbaceae bacterium]|nr:acyltransferase [Desulfobulbaceae bacterium]
MQFEAATQTEGELRAALKECLRRPHGNMHHGKLYLSPDCFATPGMETNLCISRFSILDCTGSIHLGPWCMIGARSRIYTHDHIHDGLNPLLGQQERYGVVWQDKYIGRDVWIHENVLVLYQVTIIPDGVVIGAGAVLTKNPGPFEIWAGVPARKIADRRDLAPHEIRELSGRQSFSIQEHLKETWEKTNFTIF